MPWDAQLYDGRHRFVTQYGAGILAWLDPQPGERILDIGCGTGHLTAEIAAAGANVTGLDSSAEMLDVARRAYPALEFRHADAADFTVDQPYDAIFSNAALHWVHAAEAAARCMAAALRPGGRFVVEFGGHGNVRALDTALTDLLRELTGRATPPLNYYPRLGEYADLLERHGIEVRRAELFDRFTPLEAGDDGLANWVRMFRRPILDLIPAAVQPTFWQRLTERLRPSLHRDGRWHADYRRLRIHGVKR